MNSEEVQVISGDPIPVLADGSGQVVVDIPPGLYLNAMSGIAAGWFALLVAGVTTVLI